MSAEPCRPISFVDQLVRRILVGEKTQTRRVVINPGRLDGLMLLGEEGEWCPYGKPGDRLWVRESYQFVQKAGRPGRVRRIRYLADGAEQFVLLKEPEHAKLKARKSPYTKAQPGRFLYRSCARLFLKVESVRVQRLQDISEEDARAEGVTPLALTLLGEQQMKVPNPNHVAAFASLWDEVNGERDGASWEANPWVWCVSFSVDQVLVRGEGRAA